MNNKQNGMTLIGLLMVLLLCGFAAMMVVKIVPLYMKQAAVADVMESIAKAKDSAKKSSAELRAQVDRKMSINGIERFDTKVVSFKRNGSIRKMRINYEDRAHLFGRLHAALVFDQEVTIK